MPRASSPTSCSCAGKMAECFSTTATLVMPDGAGQRVRGVLGVWCFGACGAVAWRGNAAAIPGSLRQAACCANRLTPESSTRCSSRRSASRSGARRTTTASPVTAVAGVPSNGWRRLSPTGSLPARLRGGGGQRALWKARRAPRLHTMCASQSQHDPSSRRPAGLRMRQRHSRARGVAERQHHLLIALYHCLIQHIRGPDLQIKDVGAALRGWADVGVGEGSARCHRKPCTASLALRQHDRRLTWFPMCSRSRKPRVTTSAVRSPLRSSRALVATCGDRAAGGARSQRGLTSCRPLPHIQQAPLWQPQSLHPYAHPGPPAHPP